MTKIPTSPDNPLQATLNNFSAISQAQITRFFNVTTYKLVWLGVAVEDDIYKEARQQIEQELAHREAVETATRLLDEILEGIRTPERARSPVDAYITVSGVIQVIGYSG